MSLSPPGIHISLQSHKLLLGRSFTGEIFAIMSLFRFLYNIFYRPKIQHTTALYNQFVTHWKRDSIFADFLRIYYVLLWHILNCPNLAHAYMLSFLLSFLAAQALSFKSHTSFLTTWQKLKSKAAWNAKCKGQNRGAPQKIRSSEIHCKNLKSSSFV